jgi:uroporphyrinogen decarboxylase
MNSRRRFIETMRYGNPDYVPYFEEGIRDEVLKVWHKQGLPRGSDPFANFPIDKRVEIQPDVDPIPELKKWPSSISDLDDLQRRLDPNSPNRLPGDWSDCLKVWQVSDQVTMLRVNHGFFQNMGVDDWNRFIEIIYLLTDDPEFIKRTMNLYGELAARMSERIIKDINIDAAIFSEPIGGNDGPLISPKMYEEIVLPSYEPALEVLRRHGVEIFILRTYANARKLIPSMLKWGFNCLWACEVNIDVMDYRDLRREYGRDLRLIGGIDLDALREGKEAIRKEVEDKVPALVEDGGFVPLADGRIRKDVAYDNYVYYRELLRKIIQGN